VLEIVESNAAAERLAAARDFLTALGAGTEALLLGATRGAVDDLVRSLPARATFGLHRFSLPQLAASLAAPELAGRGSAPATTLAAEALAARAAFEALGGSGLAYFAPVARLPGFARSLARTLAELRLAGVGAGALRALPGPGADLAGLLTIHERLLEAARLMDRPATLEAAARAWRAGATPLPRAVPLLLLDLELASPLEAGLVGALASAAPRALATVPAGDARTVEALESMGARRRPARPRPRAGRSGLERLREHLFSDEAPPPPEADDASVKFFSAPGEAREAVEIARNLLDEARAGVAFDDMAVLLRSPETYAPLLETAFRRAGLPVWFARESRRPDPSGRAFLALLACRSEGLSARRFAEYLSFGQTPRPDADGAPPTGRAAWSGGRDEQLGPAARAADRTAPEDVGRGDADADPPEPEPAPSAPWRWEQLLVEASVIGSEERWARRLAGLESELGIALRVVAEDDPDSAHARRLERQLAEIGHLKRFALPVIGRLAAFPEEATWGDWLERLGALASMTLARPEGVLRVLAELEPMGIVGPASLDEVRDVLAERLSLLEPESPAHRFGRVFVGPLSHARGRSFAVVFVPGLAERMFPQRPREDPLLLDVHRARLSPALETQAVRGGRERLLLRLAAGAARDRLWLSYPRVDVGEARPRVTSFYGLDVARATNGRIPDLEEFERRAAAEAGARLAWPAPPDPARAIDPIEHDLSSLARLLRDPGRDAARGRARYLLELNPHLARSLRARYTRWGEEWSRQDGLVRRTEAVAAALDANRLRARPYSPSALEKFAACPYRFLLSAIHRLEPRPELAGPGQLDPLIRGRLFHEVQAETGRALAREGLLPLDAERLERARSVLVRTLERVGEEYRDALHPPIRRVWDDELEGLRADLVAWLGHLAASGALWHPRHFELAFGLPPDPGRDPESVRDPARLPNGAILRGSVDLVERSADGSSMRVTDHKTGADRTSRGLVVGRGEVLQPLLYALAVEATLGRPVIETRLFFCTSRGGFSERAVPLDPRARAIALDVLETIDRAVAAGFLPAAPRADACGLCDFRVVCGPHEEERTRRKNPAPLRDLDELRERP
jgi:hypothetical protein